MKKVAVFLILILIFVLFAGCETYSSASVHFGDTHSSQTGQSQDSDPTDHVHSYQGQIIAETCTNEGFVYHVCSCGHSFQDSFVPALGHRWDKWETVTMATETKDGLQKRRCSVCGAEESQVLEKLGQNHSHSYTATIVEPGCTEAGYTAHRCCCGDEFRDAVTQPLGHSWSDWSFSENGQSRTCVRCGAMDTIASSHTHDFVVQTVSPTCTDAGYKRYLCACGVVYQETISEPLGHTWSQWRVTEEPTVEMEGARERICLVCGEKETGRVDVLQVENGAIIVFYSKTVAQGETATVRIKGRPGIEYGIIVFYKSGPATAAGLGSQFADADGYVTWEWTVAGRTTPGTYEIKIIGDGIVYSIYFTIVPKA